MLSEDDLRSCRTTALPLGQLAALEQLHHAHDRIQWIADVVAEHREQVGLLLDGLFGPRLASSSSRS